VPFEAEDGTVPFEKFVSGLTDLKFMALDCAIDHVLSVRCLELVRSEWLKALGGGLHEFRVRHDAAEVLLRVFVHFHGDKVVLLLGGYDKGKDTKPRRQ